MTDIWRSFVVQRILWEHQWRLSFRTSTVYQQRNDHSLMRDFEEEIPGYLNNEKIRNTLMELDLRSGAGSHGENLRRCYGALVKLAVIGHQELPLLNSWITAVESLSDNPI
jgi:hypothetical protein